MNIPLQPSVAKNNPRTLQGWAFFDWANSAYSLVITVAIFPIYFNEVTDDIITVFGVQMADSTLFSWSISFAYLIIALITPLLSGIADYGGRRMLFLRFFTMLGALACIGLFFFTGMKTLWVGELCFILATIGFAGGFAFYNSFLPLIATVDRYDAVSAKGYMYGFTGSVILLIVCLVMINNSKFFGFPEATKAVQAAFVMVGLWWIGFSQIPFRRLPADVPVQFSNDIFKKGYTELKKVWKIIRNHRPTLLYLAAFFCFNAGIQTVLLLASIFASKELNFSAAKLIILVLILQIVAIGGAWLSARISERKGNRYSLMLMLFIWTFVCIGAYFVQTGLDFYLLAVLVGLVMGGAQSIARSTYAKFIPENTPDTASFFSFYDVADKCSTVAGTFTFGIVEQMTGSMRNSVLSLTIFFIASQLILWKVKVQRIEQRTPQMDAI